MAANSSVSLVGLDFDSIKNNLIQYLQSQDTFKDYNFLGSGLNTLLDVLAYNTQYNAFYLNMVANEMFLDTALQRSSVVSHAKLLDYVPKSAIAPTSFTNVVFNGVTDSSFTIPAYTNFMSESINGINYNFVTTNNLTVNTNTTNNTATFNNVEIKQGLPTTYTFTVSSTTNPNYVFELPDADIDTSTIQVAVQVSSTNTSYQIFNESTTFLSLDGSSLVYFLDESLDGNYQISFGDGILGKQLSDGNIIKVGYIVTQGSSASGANNFVLMDSINQNYSSVVVTPIVPASNGSDKETIDSIKYQAPKSFAAQNRAVTKDDYITLIQQNTIGITFDAVNVWGGEENNPPIYGQAFVCLKPTGALTLTDTQKQELITNVLKPISVVTVEPTIVDPDYTYIKLSTNVLYNSKLTNYGSSQISSIVSTAINNYTANNLNTFNSVFSATDVAIAIKTSDASIITSETDVMLQKKIYPNLNSPTTYNLYFNVPLERGLFTSGVTSSPSMTYFNPAIANNITGVYIEEIPSATSGVQNISIINPGYSYQVTPTVTISGDGSGANAYAILNTTNGSISSIQLTSSGNNYSYAVVTITPAPQDTTGSGGAAAAILTGSLGTLRSYYYNNNIKTILNSNVGSIDYGKGIITLNNFNPVDVNNPLGELTITATPKSQIISSTFNTIITVDPYDPNAIVVSVTAQ